MLRRRALERFDLLQVAYMRDTHPELGPAKGKCDAGVAG
jgi:hypothetical protein